MFASMNGHDELVQYLVLNYHQLDIDLKDKVRLAIKKENKNGNFMCCMYIEWIDGSKSCY